MNDQLDRRMRELVFLERIARASATAEDHAELLRSIIDEATDATGTEVCSLYLWDERDHRLVLRATNGLDRSGVGRVALGLGEGVTGWVAAQRRALAVVDVHDDERFVWVSGLDEERFTSMLSVPILSHGDLIGVMNVQTVRRHTFAQEDIDLLSAVAAQIAGIVELSVLNDRLARQLVLERETVRRLRALDASKQDLLAMLSHDFRNPLAVARAYLEGLASRMSGGDRDACEAVEQELLTLERMVDDLLTALRSEAEGALALEPTAFDLVTLVNEHAERVTRSSPGHPVAVSAPPRRIVVADRAKVAAVLQNLLGNAVKYSPRGGIIEVSLVGHEDGVEVRVRDHGEGIDAREAETIFERFGRGRASSGVSGHGLGLYICKRIVEAHGGAVYARPAADGSVFAFTLPAVEVASPSTTAQR